MSGYLSKSLFIAFAIGLSFFDTAWACPQIDGLVDYNCDQKVRITITGDSFVRGIGDDSRKGGGYVRRLKDRYPEAEVLGIGVAGITTARLLESLKKNFLRNGPTRRRSVDADIYIIDVGRNDFWVDQTPELTVRNIRRIVSFIRSQVKKFSGVSPLVGVTTLAPTTRGYERSFIEEVNAQLLALRSNAIPVYIRMDTLDISLISYDGLHPSALGYDALAEIAQDYASRIAKPQQLSKRPDNDDDGIYDSFERRRFGTDPKTADSDGDGYLDGQEVFVDHSNPIDPTSFGPQASPTPTP